MIGTTLKRKRTSSTASAVISLDDTLNEIFDEFDQHCESKILNSSSPLKENKINFSNCAINSVTKIRPVELKKSRNINLEDSKQNVLSESKNFESQQALITSKQLSKKPKINNQIKKCKTDHHNHHKKGSKTESDHESLKSASTVYEIPASSYIKSDSEDEEVQDFTVHIINTPKVNKPKKIPAKPSINLNKSELNNETHIKINKNQLKQAFELLSEPNTPSIQDNKSLKAKRKFSRTCHEGYDQMLDLINWQSYAFAVRHIRNLILNRDWDNLKELLRIMLKQHKSLKNYIKELTYLYFMINADSIDPQEVEDYFLLCFAAYDKTKKPLREFDIWFRENEYQ